MGVDPKNSSLNNPTEKENTKQTKEPENVFIPEDPKYSLDDIILPQSVKDEILDVATYAENSHLVFEIWGFKKTHKFSKRIGVNLYGPPGTGKTMAAHAIAKNLNRKILIVNYADIESKFVGETPKNIRRAFEAAKATNSILFFDEADAILSKRVTNMTSATDVSVNQTRSVMLMLMNEYQDFIIFATNFIENFDPAFMRRISMHVKFELPDADCRRQLWKMYIPTELPNNINVDKLATMYSGISGSDIANAMLNSAFKAARQNANLLDEKLVCEAVENILDSKAANAKVNLRTTTRREISEEEFNKQFNS
ncbi:MAG: ATP-binding protein [Selenomonadaceae bacterium]|nr:ATP-binding protein [Selenomonadaceae bacterium]MBR1858589.1 ATP-binding protein [Selenomonadaceae bacterium]